MSAQYPFQCKQAKPSANDKVMKTILSTNPADWKASPHGSKTIDQMVAMKKNSALLLLTLTLIGASASWSAASTLPQASFPRPSVLAASAEVTAGANATEVIVIDAGISDAAKLADDVRPGIRVMMLNPKTDELAQLASALQNQHGLSAIHVVSHGAPGVLQLGTQTLGNADLAAHRQEWSAIGRSLRPGGEILLYGCSIAKGPEGQNMVHALAALTGVNVAASTDQTGAADLGGNWKLEYCTSGQPMASPFVAGFQYHNILPANRVIDPESNSVFVRPGGTSYVWTVGNSTGPTTTPTPVTTITYWNVPANSWNLTRGSYQYSANHGASWTTFNVTSSPNYMSVAGTIWRFVDATPNDKTTVNTVATAWQLQGFPNSTTSTSTEIIPDNPPTDITINNANISIFNNATTGKTLTTLTPVDTGSTLYGYWAIDSQSVPNLLVLTNDSTTGNTAALNLGTGLASVTGTSATVTVHYYDMYQTDTNGNPISGQGISKTFNVNVVPEATTNLNFTPDLLVNTYTNNDQSYQAMATLTDGSFVIVWQSAGEGGKADNTYYGIYGQRFTSTGTKIGSEFLISNTGSTVDEMYPAITALPGGRYAVAYLTTPPNTNANVGVRIIETNGTVGSQIIANTTYTNNQIAVCLTTLTNGSFVVAWASDIGDVKLQQFATNGATIGSPVTIAIQSGFYPGITALANGSYVIAWIDYNTGDVFEQIGSSGSVVDTGIYSAEYGPPHMAKLANGFAVISDDYDSPTSTTSQVECALYNNSNVLQGSLFHVNSKTDGNRFYSTVATTSDGGFVVLWESDTDDFDLDGIFGRRFTSTGTPVDASDFEVNQHRSGDQVLPSVTALPNDVFAGAWTTYPDDGSTGDVYARVLLVADAAPTFVGSTTSLLVGENAGATNITGLLHVSDSDSGQTETWSQYSAPSHGTLAFSGAMASSGSANITPGGTITYTPASNYSGSDSFTVQVSDGAGGTATRTIAVTVNPPTGITSSTTSTGVYGNAFTYTITASNSPTGFGASGLPTGLSVNTGNGVISGTPTQPGNFPVTVSATNATSFGTATLTLTISQANLSISGITANNKTYDSTTTATLNAGAATLNGVVHGDSIILNTTGVIGTFADPNVGTAKAVTISGLTFAGDAAANYTLTQPTAIANILPATLAVSGIIASNKVYDGTTFATLSVDAATLNGVINGDSVALNTNGATGTFADANVGTNKTVTISGLIIGGTQSVDYTLIPPTTIANILPATLTVSGIIASNKFYDGNNIAALNVTGATLNGMVHSDSITLNTNDAVGTFADANVGNDMTVTISGLIFSGSAATNYILPPPTTTANILPTTRAVVILHRSVQLYDGTPKSVTATTLPLGLTVNLTYNGSSAPSAAGAYTVVGTIGNPNFSGSATNYLYVVAAPQFSNVQPSNTNIVFTWTSMPQMNYQVMYTPSLLPITWSNFNGQITATNTTTSATDVISAGSSARFYRVKVILE